MPVDGDYVTDVLPTMLLLGTGAGLSFPALMTLAMSGATPSDAGLASGLVNTTLQVGGALGLAVLATLSATRSDTLIEQGESDRRGPDRGLPAGVPDRGRAGGGRHRRRGDRAAARARVVEEVEPEAEPVEAEPAYSEAA